MTVRWFHLREAILQASCACFALWVASTRNSVLYVIAVIVSLVTADSLTRAFVRPKHPGRPPASLDARMRPLVCAALLVTGVGLVVLSTLGMATALGWALDAPGSILARRGPVSRYAPAAALVLACGTWTLWTALRFLARDRRVLTIDVSGLHWTYGRTLSWADVDQIEYVPRTHREPLVRIHHHRPASRLERWLGERGTLELRQHGLDASSADLYAASKAALADSRSPV